KRGEYIKSTLNPDYVPVPDIAGMRMPKVKDVTLIWRKEPTVLASLVKAGQADLVWDIGTENTTLVPHFKSGETTEVFAFTMDTIWNPELKKLGVRQAIANAVDCKAIVTSLLNGQSACRGNIAYPGVLGITDRNDAPYPYNPDLAKKELKDAGY